MVCGAHGLHRQAAIDKLKEQEAQMQAAFDAMDVEKLFHEHGNLDDNEIAMQDEAKATSPPRAPKKQKPRARLASERTPPKQSRPQRKTRRLSCSRKMTTRGNGRKLRQRKG